jgi:cation-transporting ATPase E
MPQGLSLLGLVALSDELRPEAQATLAAFANTGVRLKIISGDNPRTVAALARQAGFPAGARLVSGHDLTGLDDAQFVKIAESGDIFGRIVPQQKERLVRTLRARGHYVAMIGDGVNDVLSLKQANLGIAMQSGSQAARGVADIILMGDSFGALPPAVLEGQRIIVGMQDILKLFLVRVLYVTLLVLSISSLDGFPFEPKHISVLTLLTVGIPTLALAAWARPAPVRQDNLVRRLVHFVLPAGLTVSVFGLGVFLVYYLPAYITARSNLTPIQEILAVPQSAITTFVVFCGLALIPFVEPPTRFWRGGDRLSGDWRPSYLALGLLVLYAAILAIPQVRDFFSLQPLRLVDYLLISAITVVWALCLRWIWRARVLERFLSTSLGPDSQQ